MLFSGGGDYWYLFQTGVKGDSGVTFNHDDEAQQMPDAPHAHDPLGGGEIAFNAWQAALCSMAHLGYGSQPFFRFTTMPDSGGNPVEIADGALSSDPYPKHYVSVWRFIYSPEKIQARLSGSSGY